MAHAVVRTVADAVPGRTVTTVTLRVGVASGVVPEALAFAWDVATAGGPLAGSRLDVVRVPLALTCRDCAATGESADPVHVRCPACGGRAVDVVAGRELEVASVEVDDASDQEDATLDGICDEEVPA